MPPSSVTDFIWRIYFICENYLY